MPCAFSSVVLAELEGTLEKSFVNKKIDAMPAKEFASATAAMKQYCKKRSDKNSSAINPNFPLSNEKINDRNLKTLEM